MSENRKKKKKQIPPPKQLRYLISSLNTPFGSILCNALSTNIRKTEVQPIIYGTTINDTKLNMPLSSFVKKTIDTTKISFLGQLILDCDVIIYDLSTCDPSEAEYAIKTLKMGEFKEEKTLICVSNVMVWADTPPKEKKEGEEEGDVLEEEQEEPDTEPEEPPADANNENPDELPQKKQYVRFTEKDYTLRKPSLPYAYMKSLETLCLAAGKNKPNLKSYVICSGILYGQEEYVFRPLFEQAWLQNPPELAYYGNGKNRIPMIHIEDLAEFVKKTVERPPANHYIFAIDYNKKPTQKGIIKAISMGVGTGKVIEKKVEEMPEEMESKDVFLLNLRMRPSRAFVVNEELEENNEEEEEGAEKVEKFKFNWISKEGIQKNIEKINLEFNKNNSLKSNRIFITGPPGSGKTHYGQRLAEFYNIPHIVVKDLFKKALELPEEDELGTEIRTALEEVKNDLLSKAQEKLEKEKEKMEKKGLKVPENWEVDPNTIFPRIPDELLYKLYKKRLMLNDCQNRGFVLDGYPKNYDQAKGIFLIPVPAKEGEDDSDENRPLILNQNIAPLTVINLEASDEYLIKRLQSLPEKKLKDTHFTEPDMIRRLKNYRDINNTEKGKPALLNFFEENKIEVLHVNLENHNENTHFDKMEGFIERKGKFKNFQIHEQIEERKRLEQQSILQKEKIEKQKIINQKMEEKETERRLLAEEEYKLKIEDFRKQEKNILDSRSLPLREYLSANVVPFVSEGIVEIYKNMPEDPVDFLAEYLFKRSLDVKYSDPKKFMDEN